VPTKPLVALPTGIPVLIDANIFIYAASGQSPECQLVVERCAKEEVLRGAAPGAEQRRSETAENP
jgi:hypothetical protein